MFLSRNFIVVFGFHFRMDVSNDIIVVFVLYLSNLYYMRALVTQVQLLFLK